MEKKFSNKLNNVNLEIWVLILSTFSYIFQLPYAIYLSIGLKVKEALRNIFSDKLDKVLILGFILSGFVSSLISGRKLEALLVSFIPIVFLWFYTLGKYRILYPQKVIDSIFKGSFFGFNLNFILCI